MYKKYKKIVTITSNFLNVLFVLTLQKPFSMYVFVCVCVRMYMIMCMYIYA